MKQDGSLVLFFYYRNTRQREWRIVSLEKNIAIIDASVNRHTTSIFFVLVSFSITNLIYLHSELPDI